MDQKVSDSLGSTLQQNIQQCSNDSACSGNSGYQEKGNFLYETSASTIVNHYGSNVLPEWQTLGQSIASRINDKCRLDYIFHTDIITEGGFDQVHRLKQQIVTSCQRKDIIIGIIYHPEGEEEEDRGHIHVYHDCPYTARTCRCGFLRGFRVKRRRHRHNKTVKSIQTSEYWTRWLQYYTQEPRRFVHLEIASMDFGREVHRIQSLEQSTRLADKEANRLVEGLCILCKDIDDNSQYIRQESQENQRSYRDIDESDGVRSREIPGIRKTLTFKPNSSIKAKKITHDQFKSIIKNLLVIPFESTCNVTQWVMDDHLSLIDSRNQDYQLAVTSLQRQTAFYTYDQLLSLHENASNAQYYARTEHHYLPMDKSIEVIESLLNHQFLNSSTKQEFLITLFNILERRLPKMNSIYISGPANCGKTYFAMMICGFYLNVGHVKNFVRGQNFPLNDCGNRRVLLWNEPSIMPSAYDTVKMLTGGDPCPAAVKYQGDTTISKTPLIFTANSIVFQKSQSVWNSRIAFYQWSPCNALSSIEGYPNPLTWKYLVDKYIK